jgi:hypothetical protein
VQAWEHARARFQLAAKACLSRRRQNGSAKAMSDKPPKPRLPDNFAAFDPFSHGRRKPRWSLRPMHEPSEGATVDAARFVNAVEVMRGLGRKPTE